MQKDFFTVLGEIVIGFVSGLGTIIKTFVLRAYKGLQALDRPKPRVTQPPTLENPFKANISTPRVMDNTNKKVAQRQPTQNSALYPDILVDYQNWHVKDARLMVEKPKHNTVIVPVGDVLAHVVKEGEPPKEAKVKEMTLEEFLKSRGIKIDE